MLPYIFLPPIDIDYPSNRLKYFADNEVEGFRRLLLNDAFESVHTAKPQASRSESSEYYFVCKGFLGSPLLPDSVMANESSDEG